MFVVLDEKVERRIFQLVEATEADKPELPAELTAVLNEQEDLAVVTFLDQGPGSPVGVSGTVIPTGMDGVRTAEGVRELQAR